MILMESHRDDWYFHRISDDKARFTHKQTGKQLIVYAEHEHSDSFMIPSTYTVIELPASHKGIICKDGRRGTYWDHNEYLGWIGYRDANGDLKYISTSAEPDWYWDRLDAYDDGAA